MTININTLIFECIIGILDFERHTPQKVSVDVEIAYPYKDEFIDYSHVTEHIKISMKKYQFKLIEEALISLQNSLKQDFPQITSLSLTISKPDILPDCRVSVTQKLNY
ncbi:MAG: dihydroneopterin aldolase [Epsilonproteobacteria bacterium]|nr:MAG: dihydroneopterin aldolase [Campylobacterota bacterium]